MVRTNSPQGILKIQSFLGFCITEFKFYLGIAAEGPGNHALVESLGMTTAQNPARSELIKLTKARLLPGQDIG
jgi:hypothetical protein